MDAIKLDLTDRKLLYELDKNCRISDSALAKKLHKSREAVRYRIKQLLSKGIIESFVTTIDPNKMGYYMFKVYLKLENIPEERKKFFNELKSRKEVYWLGICNGVFDCVFAYLSTSINSYFEEINMLLSKYRHIIISKELGTMVNTLQYNKKFLLEIKDSPFVKWGGDVINNEVDELDLKILNVLANDARIPLLHLAKAVKSSVDIVKLRKKKLEDKGIILAYRISIDFNRLGYEYVKLIIYFRDLSKKDETAIFEWMKNHSYSIYAIRSLAPWEVEFEFAVKNHLHFNEIISDLREKFPHLIRNYETLIIVEKNWLPAYKYTQSL